MLKTRYPTSYFKKEEFKSQIQEEQQYREQSRKALQNLKRVKRTNDNPGLPEGFKVGEAKGEGDCFFDAVAQGLKQLKPNIKIDVKSLRRVLKEFIVNNQQLKDEIRDKVIRDARNTYDPAVIPPASDVADDELWNAYLGSIEYTSEDIEKNKITYPGLYQSLTGLKYGSTLQVPIWGRTDIEGYVICKKYNVKLHVIEKQPIAGWSHQILGIDESDSKFKSKSINNIDYNDANTIHVINRGSAHFEPVIGVQDIRYKRSESSSDDEIGKKAEVVTAIKKGNVDEFVNKLKSLLKDKVKTNVNIDDQGNSFLHYAVKKAKKEIIEELLNPSWDTDVDSKDNEGNTALHIASLKSNKNNKNYLPIIKLLLEKKANPNETNEQGKKPSDLSNNEEISNLIRSYEQGSSSDHHLMEHEQSSTQQKRKFEEGKPEEGKPKKQKFFSPDDQSVEVGQDTSSNKRTREDEENAVQGKRKGISILDRKNKYGPSGLRDTLHGNVYQLKLLMLFLKRGLNKSYSFLLDTEMEAAEKFDDLVFQYENEKKDGTVCCFLQAKHKRNESKKISVNDLLTEKDKDFSLQKYFLSYRKIKQNPKFYNQDDELKNFVIYTNIDLGDDLQNSFERVEDEDDIIDIKVKNNSKEPKRLKFRRDGSLIKQLTSIFEEAPDLKRLAKKLAEHVFGNNNGKTINLRNPLFKKYHGALAEVVIDIQTKKFKIDFVSGSPNLPEEVKEFRKVLLEKSKLSEEDFKEKLETENLKIFGKFGTILKLEHNPQINKKEKKSSNQTPSPSQELAKYISDLIPKEKIDASIIIKKKDSIFKENIAKLIGHVFVETEDDTEDDNDTKKFRQGFLNGDELPGNLNDFREGLKTDLSNKGIQFSQLDQYQFKINVLTCTEKDYEEYKKDKSYFELRLQNDKVKTEEINEFLDKLVFAVNQPNEDKLGEIIKDELGEEFNTIDRKNVYARFLEKILDWMKDKEGKSFTYEEGKTFFEEIKKEILGAIWFNMKDPVTLFTGRKRELSNLHKALQRNQGKGKFTVISQMTSISGLGGIGKSELARKYAYDHENDYDGNAIWINAENYGTLEDSFLNLARDNRLGIPTKDIDGKEKTVEATVKEIYVFFAKRKSLFIFDNAEKNDYLSKFLPLHDLPPNANKPYVLITSRNREWEKVIEVIDLSELKLKDAIEFVKKGLGVSEEDESQDQEIKNLVEKLQHFPLAIQQAIAYIEDQRVTGEFGINDYLKEYEKKTKDLLDSKIFIGIDNCYARTTFTTWKITIDKIASNEQHGKLALKILDTISYFEPENISREIFLSLAEGDEEKLKSASRLLVKYSMVNGEQKQSVLSIHRLVQEVIRINLKDKDREKEVLRKALELFQGDSSRITLLDNHFRLDNVDHAISVWKYVNNHEELVREFNKLPVLIVSELETSLRYQEAYLFGSNALELLKEILNDDNHSSVVLMKLKIANVLYTQGKDDDALNFYRELKEKSDIIAEQQIMINKIGLILSRKGKVDEAYEIFSDLYSRVKKGNIYSPVEIENNLAMVLSQQGKIDESMKMYKDVLEKKKEVLGSNHESTLNTMNSMAELLQRQGKYDEAFKMFSKIYEKRKKILGPNHPDTLVTHYNMAEMLLCNLKKYNDALKIADEVYKKSEALFPDHPRTFKRKFQIVRILWVQGKYDEALEKSKEVYEKRKKILGLKNQDTLTTLNYVFNLIIELVKQYKYDKALKEFNNVLEEEKNIFGSNHQNVLYVKNVILFVKDLKSMRDVGVGVNIKDISNNNETLLHKMVVSNNRLFIELLLEEGAYYNVKDSKGRSPLDRAKSYPDSHNLLNLIDALFTQAKKGDLQKVEDCIEKGAVVNAKDKDGWTSLHHAAYNGHKEVVEILLNNKATVDAKATDNVTPLHYAAQNGHKEVVEILLNNKAEVNAKDNQGVTPLHYAAQNGHSGIVQLLLEKGAHYNVKDSKDRSPLDLAKSDDIKKLLSLIDNLFIQVKEGDPQNVEDCIKKGAFVNAKDKGGWTLLHYAVQNGCNEAVGALLNKGADVNAKTTDKGNTPLHIAVSKGNDIIVEILLQHASRLEVIKFNDFINAKTTIKGTTALHLAAEKGNLHVVKLLLENGAIVNIKNSVGDTPLQVAEPQSEVGKLLNIIDKLFQAVQDEKEDEVRSLLQEKKQNDGLKAILNARNTDNKTLLQVASVNKQKDIAKVLIEKLRVVQSPNQQKEAAHQEGEISAKECLPSTSHRKKREAENECLFTWEDVDEFNEEKDEKRSLSNIEIDSEKFISYVKDLPQEKRDQLIQLAGEVKVTGQSQGLINKLISNQKFMNHLNKVGMVSGITMHGMMGKATLASFLNHDYEGVAINLGFIAGGQGFAKVAQVISLKGMELASDGKVILGRSLKAASPLLARGTSAFIAYDLYNQIQEYKRGNSDALVNVVGDGVYLGVDSAEIGIEIAEGFEVLEGVSSVTGPIGAAIGAVVFVGTDTYQAIKRVENIDRFIHLTAKEKFLEGIRAFIGIKPEQQIEELIEEKQLYDQLVAQALEYLKQHSDVQRYVFPTMKPVVDDAGKMSGKIDLDNVVLFSEKRSDIKLSRARPDEINDGKLFCLPKGNYEQVSSNGSYLCENAMGLEYFKDRTGNYTYISLGNGTDTIVGFPQDNHVVILNNGHKDVTLGDGNDTFVLEGNNITGIIRGGNGTNTLDLEHFAKNTSSVNVSLSKSFGYVARDNKLGLGVDGINNLLLRRNKQDYVQTNCDTRYIDGRGGESKNNMDTIAIAHNNSCSPEIKFVIRPYTKVDNNAENGNFIYIVPSASRGESYVNLKPGTQNILMFNYTLYDVDSIDVQNATVNFNFMSNINNIRFEPASINKDQTHYTVDNNSFNVIINGDSALYQLKDNTEVRVIKSKLFAIQKTNKSVDEIIEYYPLIANSLKMSIFVQSLTSNESIAVGHGNHDVLNNNPEYKSHLVGNGGENIFVVTSGYEKLTNKLPIPEVVLYDVDQENKIDTFDLRQITKQVERDLNVKVKTKVIASGKDLLIRLYHEKDKDVLESNIVQVRLKDGLLTNWYERLHVIMNNVAMKIEEFELRPLPLVFDSNEEIIRIAAEDIDKGSKLVISKKVEDYTFSRLRNDLIMTFNQNTSLIFSEFYKNKDMETLAIQFTNKKIEIKDELHNVGSFDDLKEEYRNKTANIINSFNATEAKVESFKRDRVSGRNKRAVGSNLKSAASRPALFINTIVNTFTSAMIGAVQGVSQIISAPFKATLPTMKHSSSDQFSLQVQRTDINSTLLLLDVFIRKMTGQKYVSTADQCISLIEAQDYAINITNEFEKVVKQAASKSEISTHRLNINFMKIHDEITEEIIGGKFNEISGILKSHIEKACPDREAGYPGKLSPKKFDKFKDELNKGLDATLKQEISHSRDSKLEVSNVKGSLKPRSDLNNTYIQGHLTQARNVRLG